MVELFANSGDPDQMPHSDLSLHCLPVTFLGVYRLQFNSFEMSCSLNMNIWWHLYIYDHVHTHMNVCTVLFYVYIGMHVCIVDVVLTDHAHSSTSYMINTLDLHKNLLVHISSCQFLSDWVMFVFCIWCSKMYLAIILKFWIILNWLPIY